MAMVDVVSSHLEAGLWLIAQVGRLGPKVNSHLVLFCSYCMN